MLREDYMNINAKERLEFEDEPSREEKERLIKEWLEEIELENEREGE